MYQEGTRIQEKIEVQNFKQIAELWAKLLEAFYVKGTPLKKEWKLSDIIKLY